MHSRTRALFLLHALTHFARLIGPPIGSLLMSNYLWAPFTLAMSTLVARYVLLWFLPETSPYLSVPNTDSFDTQRRHETMRLTHFVPVTPDFKALKRCFQRLYCRVRNSDLWKFFRHRGMNVIFACFLVKRIGFASESLTFQYASEILHKQLHQTFWLRVSNALGAMLALGVLLPLVTQLSALRSPQKDVWVVRGSLIDLIIGFLMLWQGTSFATLCIGTFETGLPNVLV